MADSEDENLLVMLVQNGDVAAFERLLMRLHQPLRNYVTKMVGPSMAEDVLQDIGLQMYRQIRFLREPKAFRPWVYRIATRLAFLHLKREKRWRQVETDAQIRNELSKSALPHVEEIDSEFLSIIDHVSPASRAVLLLHYQQNLSIEEAAAILDIPVGTAKSRLSYGVSVLRNFLKEKQAR